MLHTNFCTKLREKMNKENMNQSSFNEDNETISRLQNGKGSVSSLISTLGQMGITDVEFGENIVIFK
jgi:hypothetical protein